MVVKEALTERRELTESERYRIIGRWEAGQTIGDISRKVGRSPSTVQRLIRKFQKTGQVKNLPGRGAKGKGKRSDHPAATATEENVEAPSGSGAAN